MKTSVLTVLMMVSLVFGEATPIDKGVNLSIKLTSFDYDTGGYTLHVRNSSDQVIYLDVVQMKSGGFRVAGPRGLSFSGSKDVPMHEALYCRLRPPGGMGGIMSFREISGALVDYEPSVHRPLKEDVLTLKLLVRGYSDSGSFAYTESIVVKYEGPTRKKGDGDD